MKGLQPTHNPSIQEVTTELGRQLAENFIQFLLTVPAQTDLMNLNYMFPVDESLIKGSLFDNLPKAIKMTYEEQTKMNFEKMLEQWKSIYK